MSRGGKLPRSATLTDCSIAPGHAAASGEGADPWQVLFGEQHATADTAVLCGMFSLCTAGRDWALGAAPKVTLTLDTTIEQPADAWPGRVSTLRQSLGRRAGRAAKLVVLCNDGAGSGTACAAIPALVSDNGPAFSELVVKHQEPAAVSTVLTGLIEALLPALGPHLTTLTLTPCTTPLPPPAVLPQLSSLSVSVCGQIGTVFKSISPHLGHLQSLTITYREHAPLPWPALAPALPSQPLTTFKHNGVMCEGLCSFLLKHCPALQALHVDSVEFDDDWDVSDKEWGVTELVLGAETEWGWDNLECLPRFKGRASVTLDTLNLEVCSEEGLQADECARLSQWGLNARTLCVYPAASLPTALRPAALRNTLRQLCEVLCGSGGTQLKLGGSWPWDAELLRWHVDTIPALGQRGVVSHKPSLPVAMDDALLALAVENWQSVEVPSLTLQSDTHANTPWPWDELTIDTLDIAQVGKLPSPGGQGASRKVWIGELCISDNNMSETSVSQLCERFQHIHFNPNMFSGDRAYVTLRCPDADPAACTASLRTQLSVLQALQFPHPFCISMLRIVLVGWALTHDTIEALRGLPEWARAEVDFTQCTWPDQASECTRLVHSVPTAYTGWLLPDKVSGELLTSLCADLNEHRKGLACSDVTLYVKSREVDDNVWSHVRVDERW